MSFRDTRRRMSAHAISTGLRTYAGRRWPTANAKFRKARLADILGFSERRVRSFWEASAASPRDDEIDAINALLGQKEDAYAGANKALEARLAAVEADNAALRAEITRVRMALEGGDPDEEIGRVHRRRAGDFAPYTEADERADQSHWGR